MTRYILLGLLLVSLFGFNASATVKAKKQMIDDTTPSIDRGAEVYWQRCTLCHGEQGMGEGAIPLKLKSYPNTNLFTPRTAITEKEIFNAIAMGGMLDNLSEYMPPLGNELTWTEIQSVTLFLMAIRKDTPKYLALLKEKSVGQAVNSHLGRDIFLSRCVLCHGKNGEGDGRMAKIIKTPPPFDLSNSEMSKEYLSLIIKLGGEKVGRSPQMPPWADQLNDTGIKHLVDYVYELRNP